MSFVGTHHFIKFCYFSDVASLVKKRHNDVTQKAVTSCVHKQSDNYLAVMLYGDSKYPNY